MDCNTDSILNELSVSCYTITKVRCRLTIRKISILTLNHTLLKHFRCNAAQTRIASDGWGEGFEQQEIETDDGRMYVHLWNGEGDWSIRTEEERFGPKLADGLPELCFSTLPNTGELICIKRGGSGYYPSDWSTSDPEQNRELADYNNEQLGVTPAQRHAMETGSMFGWGVPGADPTNWQEHFQKSREMTLE